MIKIKGLNVFLIPILFIVSLSLSLCSCGISTNITYFDNTTYKNLAYIKAEINTLYGAYQGGKITNDQMLNLVYTVHLDFERMIEYENSKGIDNSETVRQFNIIEDMYQRQITERSRLDVTKDNSVILQDQKELINKALGIAIKTEWSKNKSQ